MRVVVVVMVRGKSGEGKERGEVVMVVVRGMMVTVEVRRGEREREE